MWIAYANVETNWNKDLIKLPPGYFKNRYLYVVFFSDRMIFFEREKMPKPFHNLILMETLGDYTDRHIHNTVEAVTIPGHIKNSKRLQTSLQKKATPSPSFNTTGRPYTRLDAITAGICVCTGWIVVLALIYLGISRNYGGPNFVSLSLYLSTIICIGFCLRRAIVPYLKHTIRTDLLTGKR
jgi:hypothetical protein